MTFAFIADLCESHLIPSQTSLKKWDDKKLSELAYLYFLGLRILLANAKSKQWARDYCKQAGEPNDFTKWRSAGNDLYVMLYGLSDDSDGKKLTINPGVLRHWFRHVGGDDKEDMHRLFVRLDAMFHITNSAMRSMRRIVMDWQDADDKERKDVLTKLIQMIHSRAPSNSELLPHLKSLPLDESASAGATGASSVAAVVGGLGAGFDDDHSKSIYGPKKKPVIIRRQIDD